MDAVLLPLLLGGGLSVSASTAARTVSIPHLSPSALRASSTARHRRRRLSPLLAATAASPFAPLPSGSSEIHSSCSRWVVMMDTPPAAAGGSGVSRAEAVDYYAATLARVVGSEEAQMRIYEASWDGSYEFRCEIDEEASRELAKMPGVLSVRPDMGDGSEKDSPISSLSTANVVSISDGASNNSSSSGKNEFWLVRMEKPGVEVVTKAQMVDLCTQILMKVLGNEKDAQVSIYHISWERDYGFCCHIDEECANELADVPGVLSVRPDTNFGSDNKDYKGDDSLKSSEGTQVADVKTKRLFVTGLSFYTSEKTLRAAFEPFGELVEVKIIMDRISKRSKGYAFIEYTTEEAGGAALKAMNGQIINGWMIVVDVAKTRSRDHQSGQLNQTFRPSYHTR
ncbi:organelle RRM domain-containing protein 1, chloroplastic-like [Phragmites australis]|uniref:organelle RRM domain-containing protein 1, chloroplastic-like n=1 Tax=Phragmites australis TaxID=29695 RepID=UPI002D795D46|nr:organelle RRM domain-containing protein 1, chloroplastic-like [Phragmites australis]